MYDPNVKTLLVALLIVAATDPWSQNSGPIHMPPDVAIYAVREEKQALSIDPVVIVHYGDDQSFRTVPA